MDSVLLVPHGWLGDRFFTTSVGTVLKRYLPNIKVYFLSTPEFSFMDDILGSFDSIDKVVTREEASQMQFDYAFQMPHTDHSESPVKTYCRSILQVDDFDVLDFTPELIKKETLSKLNDFVKPFDKYVTYQIDWQNRTRLNVNYIINELSNQGVNCVPIGKHGLSNQGSPEQNKLSFHDTLTKIAHANYHLSMLGGTAVMATYVNTPTLLSMDHYYYKHNEHGYDVDRFMEWWGLWPNTIAQTNIHHMFHPFETEDGFIRYTLEKVNAA